MEPRNRRKSSLTRAPIESILTSGVTKSPTPPPSPHVGHSPNRPHFSMPPPARSVTSHSRAMSYTSRRPNRLSLSFPVATAHTTSNSHDTSRPTPTSSSDTFSFPPTPADMPTLSPSDPASFLVSLAGQERRVLELKEELEKAEADLAKLKKQWAIHEAHKPKSATRHAEPLQPLPTAVNTRSNNDDPTIATGHSLEIDRRKQLLNNLNIPKESRRKFSGQHTRTLSLLSPERANHAQVFPFPPVQESTELPRSSTVPDTSHGITKITSARANARHSYQGGVTHNAKQIAEDMKTGLWTFLEDLRQATVGEEAINGTRNRTGLDTLSGPRKRGSKGNLKSSGKGRVQTPQGASTSPRTWDSLTGSSPLLEATAGVWPDIDLPPATARSPVPLRETKSKSFSLAAPSLDDLDDGWSNWDSPVPKSPRWSGSTTISDDPLTPSQGSPDTRDVRIFDPLIQGSCTPSKADRIDRSDKDEIQWPALDNLKPENLKRTVSTIMSDWEKSLSPQPGTATNPLDTESSCDQMLQREEKSEDLNELKTDMSAEVGRSTQDELVMMSR